MIDSGLFQILLFVLVVGLLVLLVLVYNSITAMKKDIEDLASRSPQADAAGAGRAQAGASESEPWSGGGGGRGTSEGWAATGAGASSGYGQATEQQPAAQQQQQQQPEARQPASSASEYASWSEQAWQGGGTEATATSPSEAGGGQQAGGDPTADMPEEQPFERDGRWWFKRGDELLIYDEQGGQWVPAPGQGGGSQAARDPGYATGGASEGGGTGLTGATEQGGHWKCPSCGAVNGATSSTCRMCFAARP